MLARALPVGVAVAAYGVAFGVLAVAAGLSPLVATASSVLVLAGGSQFAFIGVLAAGGHPFAGAVSGLLLNVRYVAFGFALAPHLPKARLPRRLTDAYLVVDESVAIALADPSGQVARTHRIVGWTVVTAWIGATAAGAYGGQLLGDPRALGLDAAFPAGFLALLAPWLRRPEGRRAAVAGAVIALALTPVTPPGVALLGAALGVLAGYRKAAPPAPPDQSEAGHAPATGRPPDPATATRRAP